MDVLNIKGKFMTGLMSKLLKLMLKKSFGCDVNIQLGEFKVSTQDNDVTISVNAATTMTQDEFGKLLTKLV